MDTENKAKEIWDYCVAILVGNTPIYPQTEKDAIKEIGFMLETD